MVQGPPRGGPPSTLVWWEYTSLDQLDSIRKTIAAAASAGMQTPVKQRMKLTGAAILVSRGMKVLQAAPAAYPYRSA